MKIAELSEPLSVSRVAELRCESVGSRPKATITWWKKGKFIKAEEQQVLPRSLYPVS